MQIYDFTQPELDVFRHKCNFTPDEEDYFELRARAYELRKLQFTI